MTAVVVLAWATLLALAEILTAALVVGLAATASIVLGVGLVWRRESRAREVGWLMDAVGLAGLAVAWLGALTADA